MGKESFVAGGRVLARARGATLAGWLLLPACAGPAAVSGPPRAEVSRAVLPGWSEQLRIREGWLAERHARLLELMRRHGVSMWIVVNEEFHDDPLTWLVAPAVPYAGGRDVFVFVDAGADGLRRHAVTGYWEEALARFFDVPRDPSPPKEALAALWKRYQPRTLALSVDGTRGVTRSLTKASYEALMDAFGPEARARVVPAEPLIEEYSDTRLASEEPVYRRMVELTAALAARALSSEVIVPGRTTVGDVRRWLFDQAWAAGVSLWFEPDLRVQRRGETSAMSRGFLAVAEEGVVIERGDLVHVDFGITFMGLNTDWQKMAYVLRDGETAAPPGLAAALERTKALQDVLMREEARPGRPSGEVWEATMAKMRARGIEAQIYSHPLGNQGHALGPSIDGRAAKRNEPSRPLRAGSYLAVELSTSSPVPEWGGQRVFMMEEDPAVLRDDGYRFFVPRQETLALVR